MHQEVEEEKRKKYNQHAQKVRNDNLRRILEDMEFDDSDRILSTLHSDSDGKGRPSVSKKQNKIYTMMTLNFLKRKTNSSEIAFSNLANTEKSLIDSKSGRHVSGTEQLRISHNSVVSSRHGANLSTP